MRKQDNKGLFFQYSVLFFITMAAWCLLTAGRFHAALSFFKKMESDPETSFTSTNFRHERQFQDTLSHYRFFGSLYQEQYSTAVPGLEFTDILGESCSQMVPQGICAAGDYMLVTAYDSGDVSGKNTGRRRNPSVLYVLSNQNPQYRELLTTVILPDINHVGGIAFDGSNVWIAKSTDRQCSVISYKRIKEAAESGNSSYELMEYDQNVPCGVIASFVTWHDSKLWIGTYNNRISGKGWLRSFQVKKEQEEEKNVTLSEQEMEAKQNFIMQEQESESKEIFTLQKQDEMIIPGFANGAAFLELDGKTYLTVTTSRGRCFDSIIYFYEVHKDSCTGKNVYYSFYSCKFPPMAEELVCDGKVFYFLFESSATCYSGPVFWKCSYPVDRICAVPARKLLCRNPRAALSGRKGGSSYSDGQQFYQTWKTALLGGKEGSLYADGQQFYQTWKTALPGRKGGSPYADGWQFYQDQEDNAVSIKKRYLGNLGSVLQKKPAYLHPMSGKNSHIQGLLRGLRWEIFGMYAVFLQFFNVPSGLRSLGVTVQPSASLLRNLPIPSRLRRGADFLLT